MTPELVEVRWKRPGIEKSWRYGTLASWRTGSSIAFLAIIDRSTGGTYNVRRDFVQQKVRGPRGGVRWEPI